ncbi:MAG: hypothetical protein COT33_02525 [Candidatus Nealsonbacteria bacterium CG08_land_8_20_14_0_20_38_20]|uniref:Uncharacterized protein n=1 Tax=Candidatus Nealsonbacteria bacterium CG08_land_8_20_14_0_20_38_20 TaxID=1974705 RepID=A0A2H0YLI4_9BACT|nr:MAG: hypothetical protein COT33_02525 [Candidatus Nealsonbacteria bacterium CG08_land_8_20_14_0_20_38_20]
MTDLGILQEIIEDEFLDIVKNILKPSEEKLRVVLNDKSFIDIRLSQKVKNRFDFHWERRHINGTIFRYDNFPDIRFKHLKSFPEHFHYQKDNKVIEAKFRKSPKQGFKDFMNFVRSYLKKEK